jgi:hypothetical protein
VESVAITNLSGDLAHPLLLGLLHANDESLEVELELVDEDEWFDREPPIEYEEEPRGWLASLWHRIRR